MLYVAGGSEAVGKRHRSQSIGWKAIDWTELKTPIAALRGSALAMLRRSVALAERLCVTCSSISLGEPALAKVQSQQRGRPDWSAGNTTSSFELGLLHCNKSRTKKCKGL
jgi:hypothetical protein